MRIGYFTNQYPAPSHTFIRREIAALEARGHEVDRYAIRPSAVALKDADDLSEARLTRHLLRAGIVAFLTASLQALFYHPRGLVAAFASALRLARGARNGYLKHLICLGEAILLARWCRDDGIAHLHVHFGTNPAAVAAIAHEISGTPFSFTVHGPEEFDRPEELGLSRKAEKAAFVVAISSFGRSQLMRWIPAEDWQKIHIVPCGIDEDYRREPASEPSTEFRLVNIGRLCEQKGQMLLVEAAARLRDAGVAFQLVLVGGGPLKEELERTITRLSLEKTVILAGWLSQDEVRREITRARAMVLPSFAEGLPVVLMETMALMRPAISTYVAGIPELLTPETGWLVPAGDVESLADAMRTALTASEQELARMGMAGRRRVLEHHDIAVSAERLEGLFAVSQKTRSPAKRPLPAGATVQAV